MLKFKQEKTRYNYAQWVEDLDEASIHRVKSRILDADLFVQLSFSGLCTVQTTDAGFCRSFSRSNGLTISATKLPAGTYWSPVTWCNASRSRKSKSVFQRHHSVSYIMLVHANMLGSTFAISTGPTVWWLRMLSPLSKVLKMTVDHNLPNPKIALVICCFNKKV